VNYKWGFLATLESAIIYGKVRIRNGFNYISYPSRAIKRLKVTGTDDVIRAIK